VKAPIGIRVRSSLKETLAFHRMQWINNSIVNVILQALCRLTAEM